MTQVTLRRRARTKLGSDAAVMFFTSDGLEQATSAVVAAYRASRAVASGHSNVLDLTCGLGGDMIAFCRAGLHVVAVDRDPLTAAVAAANLEELGLSGLVDVASAEQTDRSAVDLVCVDPSRRRSGTRVFAPDEYSPPWHFVESLLGGEAVVKAAPGLAHSRVPAGVEADWVSLDGQLRETTLWSGRAARVARRATLLSRTQTPVTLTEADDPGSADVRPPGRYVYEPDDAVIRAHLVTAVAAEVSGWLLDGRIAYVSSDRLHPTRLARAYEVLEVLPFKEKSLRAALRARDVGPLTIKKRGVTVTPETLRRRLRLSGRTAATIIVSRTPRGATVLLVQPLTPPA
jgi:SAM-dependent methyltransferase